MKKEVIQQALVMVCLVSIVEAAEHTWTHSRITNNAITPSGYATALALRNGDVWPTIGYMGGAATLTPAGWIKGPALPSGSYYVKAATAGNGAVAFSYYSPGSTQPNNNTTVVLDENGWNSYPVGGRDVAFNKNNELSYILNDTVYTRSGNDWQTLSYPTSYYSGAKGASLAYDSYGQINTANFYNGSIVYGIYGVLTNYDWVFQDTLIAGSYSYCDMVLTTQDKPVIASISTTGSLICSTYDIKTTVWSSEIVGYSNYQNAFTLASDKLGGFGLAFVQGGYLEYKYFDGTAWTVNDTLIPINFSSTTDTIGLDFDDNNNPVISYCKSGAIYMAYDPVVTPEPASMALMAMGLLLYHKYRK